MVDNNTNKIYRTFKVGGDPTKIAFLAMDLSDTVNKIQLSGWTIERIDSIDNTCAWDFHKQKYVSTTEYIIIAYCNDCEEEKCTELAKETERPKNKLRYLMSPEYSKELVRIADEASERMLADHHCSTCKNSEQVPHYEMGKDAGTDSFCKLRNELVLDYYEGGKCKNYEVKDEYK